MAERVQKTKTTTTKKDEVVDDVAPADAEKSAALKEEMDDLLDEIDGVLEENAEEFVKGYVQKGGQ